MCCWMVRIIRDSPKSRVPVQTQFQSQADCRWSAGTGQAIRQPRRASRSTTIGRRLNRETMSYSCTLRGERFVFSELRELLAKANEVKSGDELAGLAARSERERVAAKLALADVPLATLVNQPVLDPDNDDVSRLILDTHDRAAFAPISSLTVGAFREFLLDDATTGETLSALKWAITPEIAAAVAKLMGNKELVYAAAKIRNVTRCRNTMGQRDVFGVRVQPNHPADDLAGILVSAIDGLSFGCGDAVIGVNPATDSVESVAAILHLLDRLIAKLEIPTQACCLAHITTQLEALYGGAPVDLLFQSVAGTQAANASFGVTLAMLKEGRERVMESRGRRDVKWVGEQVMYFET